MKRPVAIVARQEVLELLPPEEEARRDHLDAIIRNGLQTYVEVGAALCEIRDRRLYRSTHASFRAYCEEQWRMNDGYASRLIVASRVVQALPIGSGRPVAESQARELAALEPEEAAIVWGVVQATADAKKGVTAAHVRSVAAVLKTILDAGAVDDGTGEMLAWDDLDPNHQRALLEANLAEETYERLQRQKAHVSHNSGDFEWYTPAPIVEAARSVMGAIDLDPSSTPVANRVVGASRFYTADTDGLTQPWGGRVFFNPPYGQPLIVKFTEKFAAEFDGDTVGQAVAIVNNASETAWFRLLASRASVLCFHAGRVKYWHPDKGSLTALQGQTIMYFGGRKRRFVDAFQGFGMCVAPVG